MSLTKMDFDLILKDIDNLIKTPFDFFTATTTTAARWTFSDKYQEWYHPTYGSVSLPELQATSGMFSYSSLDELYSFLDKAVANRTRPQVVNSTPIDPAATTRTIRIAPGDPLPWNTTFYNNDYPLSEGLPPPYSLREQRRKDGRCEECGELLPMSIHGLGECEYDHATGKKKERK